MDVTLHDGVASGAIPASVLGLYHTRTDIENVFGADNVLKWADLDNDRDPIKIAARFRFVIDDTESWVNSRLRRSRYTIPFTSPCPYEIRRICTWISGASLYEPRQTDDITAEGVSPMKTLVMQKKKQAEDMIRQILANKLVLDVPANCDSGNEAPAWVTTDRLRMHHIGRDEITLDELGQAGTPYSDLQ